MAARFGKVYDWSVKAECIGRGTLEAASIIVAALALPLTRGARSSSGTSSRRARSRRRPPCRAPSLHARARSSRGSDGHRHQHGDALYAIKAAPHRAWLSIFGAAVCGDDARVARPKPAPDIFLAAALAGRAAGRVHRLRRSPFGMAGARAAGMRVVALPDPAMDRARYTSADVVVAGFAELHPDALGF